MAKITKDFELYDDAAEKVVKTAECRSYLARVAQSAANTAIANAPVDTGAYRDSISSGTTEGDAPQGFISADVEYWSYLEFGTINNEPFRTLTTAMSDSTDTYEEGGDG